MLACRAGQGRAGQGRAGRAVVHSKCLGENRLGCAGVKATCVGFLLGLFGGCHVPYTTVSIACCGWFLPLAAALRTAQSHNDGQIPLI